MTHLPDGDFFPKDAAIPKFTDGLYRRGKAEVFSTEHLLRTRLLLSNSFPGKSLGFLVVWLIVDALKWVACRPLEKFSCLVIDNSPRIRGVNLQVAGSLATSSMVVWMTSPPRRFKSGGKVRGVILRDVVLSLGLSRGPSLGVYRRAAELFRETRRLNTPLAEELKMDQPLGFWDCWMHAVLLARAENFCRRHRVESVVLASDTEHFGIALAWAAHREGAEVFVLQHGTLNPHNCFGVASHLFCWTDAIRDYAEKTSSSGVERSPALRVTAVGGIHRPLPLPPPKETAADCLFLDQLTPHGLRMWGSQWAEETRHWLEELADAMPGRTFRIRCHPSFRETAAPLPRGWIRSEVPDLARDLDGSRILLTMNSTAGLEAGAMGRPVIFFWNEKMVWLDSMRDLEELVVTSVSELKERVRMLLLSEDEARLYAAKGQKLCLAHLGSSETTVDGMVKEIRKSLAKNLPARGDR